MKKLAILGSTGSIGVSTLDVVEAFPERFEIVALAGGRNVECLAKQIARHRPSLVAVAGAAEAAALRAIVGRDLEILHGDEGRMAVATHADAAMVVSALVGALGLLPTYAALSRGIDVALANKESLVVAGEQVVAAAAEHGAMILPVDSEHNALHQCLRGERPAELRRLWLTASGGPFRGWSRERLATVDRRAALNHPTWKMGPKITIDSATLMNKGLEVIEAHWLFGTSPDAIRVVVHPQSLIHSMIEMVDGSFKAQLGVTDMRHAIQYALSWPDRWETTLTPFDPLEVGTLDFEAPDDENFACLALAFAALRAGGAAPAVLNAANEIASAAFLEGRVGFLDIPRLIDDALQKLAGEAGNTLDDLLAADARARIVTREAVAAGVAR